MQKIKSVQSVIVRAKSRTTLAVIGGLAILATFAPLSSFAQDVGGIPTVKVLEGTKVNVQDLVTKGMGIAFGILLLLAGVFVFAAAFYYLTSATDEKRRATAKQLIIYSVVAIIVAAISQGIIYVVKQFIGVGLQ